MGTFTQNFEIMETRELTQDQFAQFIADSILQIDNYCFDVLYDVSSIMKELAEKRGVLDKPQLSVYHFMLRSTGCDLVKADDINYKLFKDRSTTVYELVFCWNYSYMHREPFCKVRRLV